MIELYIADISKLNIDSALARVSEYRRQKTLRLRDYESKRQSLGAELLLYRAMNAGKPFTYSLGENGKPQLDDGRCFSLSHSGSYAVCAVSDCDIGVDIELPHKDSLRLARRFFTGSEYERIAASDNPDELFCQLWTIKESFIKATGKGLSTPLSSFEAADKIGEYRTAHFKHGGYHLAVCVKCEEISEIKTNNIDL